MDDMRQDDRPGLQFPDILIYRGYAAPVRIEGDVRDLEVIGTIPAGLNGAYIRASADPAYPPLHGTDIFLNGDGMMHMVRLENGHADLKTRYVQTHKLSASALRGVRCSAPIAIPTPVTRASPVRTATPPTPLCCGMPENCSR